MTDIEFQNKVIPWLEIQSKIIKTRPYYFKPKEVAEAVGGSYTAIGRIENTVIRELMGRGINIRYNKSVRNKPRFELFDPAS